MFDFDTLLELPKLHKLEYLLLFGALAITLIGFVHQLLYLNRFNNINSEELLDSYAWFVRAQMLSSFMMLVFLVPAIIIGVFNGAENLVTALSTFALIFTIGKIFSRLEDSFKTVHSDLPELQAQVDNMIYQWEEKVIPTF